MLLILTEVMSSYVAGILLVEVRRKLSPGEKERRGMIGRQRLIASDDRIGTC